MTDPRVGPEPRVSFHPQRGAFGGPASRSLTRRDADHSQGGGQRFQKVLFLDFRGGTRGGRWWSGVTCNAVNTNSFSASPLLLLGGKYQSPGLPAPGFAHERSFPVKANTKSSDKPGGPGPKSHQEREAAGSTF